MAFIYEKPDQKNAKIRRWYVALNLGGSRVAVSLRLISNGSRRLAERRASSLQEDCDAGMLQDCNIAWLGGSTVNRISALLGVQDQDTHACRDIVDRYISVIGIKDTRKPVLGKLNSPERTKKTRRNVLLRFARWAGDRDISDIEGLIGAYLSDEISRGSATGYIRHAMAYLLLLGEWAAEQGWCDTPSRKKIGRLVPDMKPPEVRLADWKDDLNALRSLSVARLAAPICWAAWCQVVVVRGLGCRPSEAYSLSWDTVTLTPGAETVRFLDPKDGRPRVVPVLFEWTRLALCDMKRKTVGKAVCPNTQGRPWKDDAAPTRAVKTTAERCGLGGYRLKQAQKLAIRQMIQVGLPPHVVAFWTGHTLSTQEKHYLQEDAYLPGENKDYAEYGVLSEHGKKALAKFRQG